MMKVLIYLVMSLLINGMVIGEPFWQLATSIWIDVPGAFYDFYEHLSVMQIVVIGICEWILTLFLLRNEEEEMKDVDENESKNE